MEKLKQLATGMNHRFPEGNDAFQITTRLLEECGEVAKEVNRLEKSGTKVLRHGNGTKEDLASEIICSCIPVLLSLNHHAEPCWIFPTAVESWKHPMIVPIEALSAGFSE